MLFTTIENYLCQELDLTNSSDYTLYQIDGLNPVTAAINMTEFATGDGAIFNSCRLSTRNIVLYIKINPNIEKNRLKLYSYFKVKSNVTLRFRNESLNVYITGKVESFELSQFENPQIAQISIICNDPYFKASESEIVEFSNVVSLFEFPFAIEEPGIEFSRIENVSTKIINAGEIDAGITIQLQARSDQILNPTIYNRTKNEFFALNYELQNQEIITITTQFNNKKIESSVNGNILYAVADGSTWLQLAPGENEISFSCDHNENYLIVSVEYTSLYEGI